MAENIGWEENKILNYFVLKTGYNVENYVYDGVREGYPCLGNEKRTKAPPRQRSPCQKRQITGRAEMAANFQSPTGQNQLKLKWLVYRTDELLSSIPKGKYI